MSELSELPASQSMSRSQRLVSPVLRVSLLLGVAVHLVGFLVFKVRSSLALARTHLPMLSMSRMGI